MCGIVACLSTEPFDRHRLQLAAQALAHRGPDGAGLWVAPDGRVGLAHRRLAQVDTSGGAQPIANEDSSILAVVNGEFYTDQDLRRELSSRGHRFRSGSDSELLVHLYEEYGEECLDRLRGEFAFVLYDRAHSRLLAARDRFGVKPLVYLEWGRELWFASEAKAFFAAGWPANWDLEAFAHAAATQYPPPDRSFFAGVRQLPPGHLYSQGKVKRYWDVPHWREAEVEIGEALEESVRLRLRGEHPPCFALSAGLDSSAVVALASRYLRPHCFCVCFPDHPWDESQAANQVADRLEVHLELVEARPEALMSILPQAVAAAEGVAVNGHLPARYLLYKAMRRAGFKAVLSGEGSDEVFLGYPHFFGGGEVLASNPSSAGIMLTQEEVSPLPAVLARLGSMPEFMRAKAALGAKLCSLLAGPIEVHPYEALLAEAADRKEPVEKAAYLWIKTALCQYILKTLSDATEMAHAIEGRPPFLDHVLWQHAAGISTPRKLAKKVLRESLAQALPPEIRQRPKQPFMAPPLDCREFLLQPGSLFDRRRVLQALDRGEPEWAPALMWVATATLLEQAYRLT
ncbi:MAG: asparagine synthase (glutamine-hydrolyzing) [Candidatus Eremiobacteraeota bacterium]|nr:asparagine synthase (glutamine-hydrolyzing) [Candidatus Eremiobacteraeota bacterium]